ncbi:hypothetical protein CEP51_008602 [Fusarium floridanum]|uniref:Uncharacterized protein n=1 Tax=Fusarium floridanum TaxID=1325733 RepID=A0A428RKE1_9HYPO|nr:hypothetical protein CEP51_008602 [Fusarium floridanum]
MDVQDWQASRLRIRNSRYLQDGNVKPWPWSIQVQILGAEGSGRHSFLDRICLDEFIPNDDPFTERDSACKQTNLRGLACNVWFETPISLTSHGDGFALSKQELFYWLTRGMRDCDALILRGYVGRGNTGVAGVGRGEEDGIEKKTEQEEKNIRATTASVTTEMHGSTSTMDNEEPDLSTSMPKSTRYEQF